MNRFSYGVADPNIWTLFGPFLGHVLLLVSMSFPATKTAKKKKKKEMEPKIARIGTQSSELRGGFDVLFVDKFVG